MSDILDVLGDQSALTRTQLETVKIHLALRKSAISLDEALKIRKIGGISRGTHYRILNQARKNVRESVFTVAAMVQMGIARPEDLQRLLALMSTMPPEVAEDRLQEFTAIVGALVDRIVML